MSKKHALGLLEVLAELVADERKFVTCYQEAVDGYIAICNFCGASHNDKYQIKHKDTCLIRQARTILKGGRDMSNKHTPGTENASTLRGALRQIRDNADLVLEKQLGAERQVLREIVDCADLTLRASAPGSTAAPALLEVMLYAADCIADYLYSEPRNDNELLAAKEELENAIAALKGES